MALKNGTMDRAQNQGRLVRGAELRILTDIHNEEFETFQR